MTRLAFVSGLVFGIGLLLSGMTDPAKVIAFMDITGQWDPSLILVMITAVVVAIVPIQLAQRRERALLGDTIAFPATSGITGKLVAGSAVFGIGWGMTGLCPGPSLASLGGGTWREWLFFGCMVAGMIGFELWQTRGAPAARPSAAAAVAVPER